MLGSVNSLLQSNVFGILSILPLTNNNNDDDDDGDDDDDDDDDDDT